MGMEGKLVRLVPIDTDRHLENYMRWLNDPEVTEWLLVEFPIARLAEREWLERIERGTGTDVVFAIETRDGEHIGSTALHGIDYRHGFAHTGSFIGPEAERGKGYGTEAAILRCRYAFHVLGLRQLQSSYFEGNLQSARMQEKVGYEVVGRYPKHFWKRGQFRDELLTQLDRERFEKLHRNFLAN